MLPTKRDNPTDRRTPRVSGPTQAETRDPVRDVVRILAAIGGLALVLGVVWTMTQSTVAFVAIGITTVLLVVLVLAYVATNTRILRGTQLERVFLAVIEKTSVLGTLVGRRKQEPPTKGR